jgi:putative endonuclease
MPGTSPGMTEQEELFAPDRRHPRACPGGPIGRYPSCMRRFYVYILAKHRHGALYVGVTNDLIRRIYEHREGLLPGFTKRYGIKQLVYYEQHATAAQAIQREKTMKHWSRA